MERIECLRASALSPILSQDEVFYRFFKRYENSGIKSEWERYGDAFYHAFSSLKLFFVPSTKYKRKRKT